jgi:hypothetical protein
MARTNRVAAPGFAYERAAGIVAALIDGGEITDRLPGERELAVELGVSYQTLRRGLGLLRDRGLIVTRHGLGSFVTAQDTGDAVPAPAVAPAGRRDSDGLGGRVLAAIVELLGAGGYGFTIAPWGGQAYLKGRHWVITELAVTGEGEVSWGYHFSECPYLDPVRVTGMAIDLLDPDRVGRLPVSFAEDCSVPFFDVPRRALVRCGFTAVITEAGDRAVHVLTVGNPARPHRGVVYVTEDGELRWNTRAPHHRDGGIPVPEIACAISRALNRRRYCPRIA